MQFTPVKTEDRKNLDIRPGDTVKVWQRIQEGKKSRLQAFEGLLLARKHGTEPGATFTIRKISGGVGVEITLPLYSPKIEKIELISRPKRVRRAKLYYLRERAARQVRKKMKQMKQIKETIMDASKVEAKPEEDKEEPAESPKDIQAGPPQSESLGAETKKEESTKTKE